MRRALLLACVAFGWTDCLEPTEVMATITTNAKCSDVHDVSLTIGTIERIEAPAGQITTSTKACDPSTGRIGSIALVPSSSSEPAAIRVVMGLGGKSADDCVASGFKGGCIVARRAVRYVKHSKLQLPIPMQLECVDIPCGATTTCVNGNCVPAMVDQCDPIAGCVPEAGPPATARALGGQQLDTVSAITRDPAGNLHVTGQFGGSADFGGKQVNGIGTNSMFAASYDPALALRWQFVPVMETGTGGGSAVAVAAQTVIGGFIGMADFGLGSIAANSAFALSLDMQTGQALTQRTFTGTNFVVGVAFDTVGNVYLIGTCASGSVVAGATCSNQQGFLTSYDKNGTVRWTNLIGNPGSVGGLVVSGSHVIICGSILAAFDFGSGAATGGFGGSDAYVASYTLGGKYEWARVIGDGNLQNAARVVADANYVYAVGEFLGTLTDPDVPQTITGGLIDSFLWELSPASGKGHALRRLPAVLTSAVAVDQAGTVHVGGNFTGSTDIGSGTITSVGAEDGFIASIDTGGMTRVLTFGGPGSDSCNAIAVESPQSLYVGGYFNQTMTIDGATVTSHGGQDGFIAHVAR